MSAVALGRLLRAIVPLLPAAERQWATAMAAELHEIPSDRERAAFALSGLRGLLTLVVGRQVGLCIDRAILLTAAAVTGVIIASVDLTSSTRWPLRLMLAASCLGFGLSAPAVSRYSGALIGIGLPLLAWISGHAGPYVNDRGDVWFPILPAIVLTSLVGWVRALPRRPE